MTPRAHETEGLLTSSSYQKTKATNGDDSFDADYSMSHPSIITTKRIFTWHNFCYSSGLVFATVVITLLVSRQGSLSTYHHTTGTASKPMNYPTGPYALTECQEGNHFFSYYDFFNGPDSLGSAGYNMYVSEERARELGLIGLEEAESENTMNKKPVVVMRSAPTEKGPRESIRLEGKRRYNSGLFIFDLRHMPTGCGVWPAFWLTDEENWPNNGEIDVVEGINIQSVAKTALHTSESCSMYAHVPPYAKTGVWDSATGLPNTWTGNPDLETHVPADNCWILGPHQWANQGCVAVDSRNDTLGEPVNQAGGATYVLEWDPANRYIKSWVFRAVDEMPANLHDAIHTASTGQPVMPNPSTWETLPYAYFAIGETTGCSADHFKNMRVVINLAFCGTVSGNRFQSDCPAIAEQFSGGNQGGYVNPIDSCNAYIKTNPKALEEAYWKIGGVYVYEREFH